MTRESSLEKSNCHHHSLILSLINYTILDTGDRVFLEEFGSKTTGLSAPWGRFTNDTTDIWNLLF